MTLVHRDTIHSKPLFTGGFANRLWLVACGNKFFHRRVTENRLWKCISTGGSVTPTARRNIFPENMKSVFKNRKKIFYFREGSLVIGPHFFREGSLVFRVKYASRAFFRVKLRATRPVGFEPETSPSRVPSSTTPTTTPLPLKLK